MKKSYEKYEALFTPWKIGNVEIKNRIVMCPMGGTSLFGWFELSGCHFDKEAAKVFLERANNNVGLIIPGIAPLRDTFWGKWLWQNPKMFEDLKAFMDEIHKTGAKLFIQLTAGMGRSWAITDMIAPLHKNRLTRALIKPVIDTSHELASPSPQQSRWAHDIECPEMTKEQIHEIIEAFAKTAKLYNTVTKYSNEINDALTADLGKSRYEGFMCESGLDELKTKDKPLALYLFTSNKKHIRRVTNELSYGGGCINDVVIHLATSTMGFGGVGESGMGSYHGKDGFDAFSHYKSILDKKMWLDLPMRYQPYKSKLYEKLLHVFLR